MHDKLIIIFLEILKPLVLCKLNEFFGLNKVKIILSLSVESPFLDFLSVLMNQVPLRWKC